MVFYILQSGELVIIQNSDKNIYKWLNEDVYMMINATKIKHQIKLCKDRPLICIIRRNGKRKNGNK